MGTATGTLFTLLGALLAARCVLGFIEPFALDEVRLADPSVQMRYVRINEKYLLDMLDVDRLMLVFRLNAGLPAPGEPFVGSWEDPQCAIRGHFVGHYLSALALAYSSTGEDRFRDRLVVMVDELAKVQDKLGGGYLSAFPSKHFDWLETGKGVWAPYYVIHKLLVGLLDAHELGGVPKAYNMMLASVAYHWGRTDKLIQDKGMEAWTNTLDTEYGGMSEVLFRLYRITNDPTHKKFAELFHKAWFYDPMAQNKDILKGLHANTHLAQVIGFAEDYETTGSEKARRAVENFFEMATKHHGFATGGTSGGEWWWNPDELADNIYTNFKAQEVQETCTQYNMLKIARYLFRWSGSPYYSDYYERALNNGIMGVVRLPPEDWPEAHVAGHAHHHDRRLVEERGDGKLQDLGATTARHHASAGEHHHHQQLDAHNLKQGIRPADKAAGRFGASGSGAAAGKAVLHANGTASFVVPHQRVHDDRWLDFIAFRKPKPEWNVSDKHGPGVFLYMTTMGSGVSKGDNLHHWGFPFNSFWCCYGTIIESYAKLQDSIFFKEMHPKAAAGKAGSSGAALPPRLYLNQLVSSSLYWKELGLQMQLVADLYAPGPAANASLLVSNAWRPATFTLMVRVPHWVPAGAARLWLNGKPVRDCPGAPKAGTYCQITRSWVANERVDMYLPMRWWISPLPEKREGLAGLLSAVLLGPFVMVGMSHGSRQLDVAAPNVTTQALAVLGLGEAAEALQDGSRGSAPYDSGLPAGLRAYPPEEADELLSLQAAWDPNLYVSHDNHYMYLSKLEDGGDMMDATLRLGRSCYHHHHEGRSAQHAGGSGGTQEEAAGRPLKEQQLPRRGRGLLAEVASALAAAGPASAAQGLHAQQDGHKQHTQSGHSHDAMRAHMVMGRHEAAHHVSLEAMGFPNHFVAADQDGVIVMQPGSPSSVQRAANAGKGSATADACSRAMWMLQPGLDGQEGTVSLEASHRPGWYLTAAAGVAAPACRDAWGQGCGSPKGDLCLSQSFEARVLCRQSCNTCNATRGALRLAEQRVGDAAFAAASSFRLAAPGRHAYPLGSQVLSALNRHYLMAPLGNLIDERYTVYWEMWEIDISLEKAAQAQAATGSEASGKAATASTGDGGPGKVTNAGSGKGSIGSAQQRRRRAT